MPSPTSSGPTSSGPSSSGLKRSPIPRTVWMLGLVSLLMDVSSEMVQTLLPLYLVGGLGASAVTVGFIEGLSVAIATLTKFGSGLLADWMGRHKPLAVLGYGLGALSRFIFPLAGSIDLIIVAKAVDRVGKGIRGTPRDALIAAATPTAQRGEAFGLRKSMDTVGGFVGPLITIAAMVWMADQIVSVFWIATVPAALAVVVLIVGVRDHAPTPPASETTASNRRPPFRLADSLRLPRGVWLVIGLASAIMLARFSEAFLLLKALGVGIARTGFPSPSLACISPMA